MTFSIILALDSTVFASVPDRHSEIDEMYEMAYNECRTKPVKYITNDYEAYAYLLNNINDIDISGIVTVSDHIYISLNSEEIVFLKGFLERINVLIEKNAITVTDEFEILKKDAPEAESNPFPKAIGINLMSEARNHAAELQSVYNNAVFSSAHIVAGAYFAERVKGGGIWDYKVYLGANTKYYETELGVTMTGETIGNFHYGYVGSVCFGQTTLKSLAGIVQIYSGTSDPSYWKTYFDDPSDQIDIQWGINVYNASH